MFNKIQPQQIQLHTLLSPSGNLVFETTESEIKINLYSGLTGSFQIEGDLFINGGKAQRLDSSNILGGTATNIDHGQSNFVSGTSSMAGGNSNEVSGTRNAVLHGTNCQVFDSVTDGTVIVGYGGEVSAGHDGAALIADARIATKKTNNTNALTVDFENGMFVKNDLIVKDDLHVGNSGLISGDFNVLGAMLYTGKEVVNAPVMTGFVSDVSGVLDGTITTLSGYTDNASGALQDSINATGNTLNERIKYDLDDLVRQTGNQIISGTKQFVNGLEIYLDALIEGTGTIANSIILEDSLGVDIAAGTNLTLSSTDSIICLLDHNAQGQYVLNDFSTKWNDSFIVASGNNDPDNAVVGFGVHPSGTVWVKDTIILNNPSYTPTASADPGYQGQIAWERINADLSYMYLNNGVEWHRFSGVSF